MQEDKTQSEGSAAGVVKAPPRPALDERRTYEPQWPAERFIVPLLRQEIEAGIAKYATPALGNRKAIDVGCGGQPFRSLLEAGGYSYRGVDANPTEGCTVDVTCAVDQPLPAELMKLGPFDFLLCTEVLEHVADWDAAFSNFRRLLAPGGRALLTAPHFYQLHEEPYDFWRPTLHAIDYYARRAGLQVLCRRAAGDAWDVLGTILPNCRFSAASFSVFDRAIAKAARIAAGIANRALLSRRLQRSVRVQGPLYLSNVVVLEKPEHS
ncbi:MAG TPA: class I SAM-dependent methyltransferase [Candidatus Acidoferrum sp.]|nr:class I SAM-dependent methyltransferase [Candidatus Acidoferrum sp.]